MPVPQIFCENLVSSNEWPSVQGAQHAFSLGWPRLPPFPFRPLLVLTCALAWREFDLGQRQRDLPQMPDTRCWVSAHWHPMIRDALHGTGPQEVCLGAGELCWLENRQVSQLCGIATGVCPICQPP